MNFVPFAVTAAQDPELAPWRELINQVAVNSDTVPPCLLAAIVKRESHGKNVLQDGIPPGPGCGVGLCQITYNVDWSDINNPKFNGYELLDPSQNLHVAANFFLAPAIGEAKEIQATQPAKFAIAADGQVAYGAAAVYNAGWGAMQKALDLATDVDQFTTDNYASGVYGYYLTFCNQSKITLGR